ncbi:MAG: sigma-70 family RNA polymerase sigma factor [Planctomycetes bacterium]|nr:sigma-70 family RNA polymerase sigma factor [Planctomycetota bacterium]
MDGHSPVETSRAERIRRGDAPQLAAVFAEYRPRLERIARCRIDARVATRLNSDDLLQEAYLSAAQRCRHLEGDTDAQLFIWLRLILLQTLADAHRRYLGTRMRDAAREVGLRWRHPGGPTGSIGLVAPGANPSEAVRRDELAQRMHDALERMEPRDREIVILRHFEELANHEVAAVLGIEAKNASIRYFRALQRLRTILEQSGGNTTLISRHAEAGGGKATHD